jgi:UDP-N-acetylglucosamine 4,6-dehydratase
MLDDKVILVTGGTGSFGKAFTRIVLERFRPKKLIIFSRDEYKQVNLANNVFPRSQYPAMRYFLGDVRDHQRLIQALNGVDIVVHAAALKQVPVIEYNPFEAIKTNIQGAENVINAAIYQRVSKVIALSTDKAVNPINLYGATKLAAEKAFVAGNQMSGEAQTRFSVVRYGNVVGSRGSVIPYFRKLVAEGADTLPITDPRMTRFWITLPQAVELVLNSLERMRGGELFIPRIPSMKLTDLAAAICPDCGTRIIGIRPGEKVHETLAARDEAHNTLEYDDCYIILPSFWSEELKAEFTRATGGRPVGDDFEFRSDHNPDWLTVEQLRRMIDHLTTND